MQMPAAAVAKLLKIAVADNESVSGLLLSDAMSASCFVFAHGAGAGMEHPFMAAMADALLAQGIATLRFQFPYMEKGSRRPDRPPVAHAAIRAAVAVAYKELPSLRLFAGGKSFGGRMTSQAQAVAPLPGVRGLIFLGFPLHPASKPSRDRAEHLAGVHIPMLFLAGTRDELADLDLLRPTVAELGDRATLHVIEGADHSFKVPVRLRLKKIGTIDELAMKIAAWCITYARHQTSGVGKALFPT